MYGPLVDGSIVLYGSKLPILLLDVEEACFVWTFGWSDGALFRVFHHELV
jgi:hypothetical protein